MGQIKQSKTVGRSATLVGLASLLLAFVASSALASTVLRFSPNELADNATLVIHGKVESKQARPLGGGVIVTNYVIKVSESLHGGTAMKGAKAKGEKLSDLKLESFTFSAYGGVTAKRGSGISGAASYEKGEEILVFLTGENKIGCRAAVGLAQGKYTIRLVEGKRLAFRDLEGLRLMDRKSGAIEEAETEQGVPFDSLLAGVKKRLAENKTKLGQ